MITIKSDVWGKVKLILYPIKRARDEGLRDYTLNLMLIVYRENKIVCTPKSKDTESSNF